MFSFLSGQKSAARLNITKVKYNVSWKLAYISKNTSLLKETLDL